MHTNGVSLDNEKGSERPATASRLYRRKQPNLGLLMQIGTWRDPGITIHEFDDLMEQIIMCRCGLLMLEKRFAGEHHCNQKLSLGSVRLEYKDVREEVYTFDADDSYSDVSESLDN
jgi:hypothetical protein